QRLADVQTEDRRGEAGDRIQQTPQQAHDPDGLPEQRGVWHRGGADGDRRGGGGADLLRQARVAAEPGAERAAGGAAAGALAVQPVLVSPRGAQAPQRGAGEDGRTALHLAPSGGSGGGAAAGNEAQHLLLGATGELLLRIRAPAADPSLWARDGGAGRVEGVYDDRLEHAALGAQGDRGNPQPPATPR